MMALAQKTLLVTGGSGFLGKFVVARLKSEGITRVFVPRKREYDLCHREATAKLYADVQPQILIHLAAAVGGIGANRKKPGRVFFENMAMGLNIIEEGCRYGNLDKLFILGTNCSFPKNALT